MAPVPAAYTSFARSSRGQALGFLVAASAVVVWWKWDSLRPHARGLILAGYGVTLAGLLLIEAFGTRRLLTSGAMARGTVVGAERQSGGLRDRGSFTYRPVVRFTTADGRTVTFTSAVGYRSRPEVGGAVGVRYLPADPEQAAIDSATLWVFPAVVGLVFGLGLLAAGVVIYNQQPQFVTAAGDFGGESVTPESVTPESVTAESVPPERPPPPEVATGRIGDTLTVHDASGRAQLAVTVTRLRFATDDKFARPEHGFYMGAHVKAHALSDEQDALELYALVRGRHYEGDAYTTSTAFEPLLDFLPFNKGERLAGWMVFDVPARHGQLVLDNLDGDKVAVWTY